MVLAHSVVIPTILHINLIHIRVILVALYMQFRPYASLALERFKRFHTTHGLGVVEVTLFVVL